MKRVYRNRDYKEWHILEKTWWEGRHFIISIICKEEPLELKMFNMFNRLIKIKQFYLEKYDPEKHKKKLCEKCLERVKIRASQVKVHNFKQGKPTNGIM